MNSMMDEGAGDDGARDVDETRAADDVNARDAGLSELEVQLVEVLVELWRAHQAAPEKPWSLAKLSKRSQLPMSTLRRLLTELNSTGLVDVVILPDGTGSAELTAQGLEVCAELFAV